MCIRDSLRARIARLVALPSARRGAGRWLAGVALLGAVAVAVFGGTRFAARNAETLVGAPVSAAATGVPAEAATVPSLRDVRGVPAHGPATTIPEFAATRSLATSRVVPEPVAPDLVEALLADAGLVEAGLADAGYLAGESTIRATPVPASFARFVPVARPVPAGAPGVVPPPESPVAAGSPTEREAIVGDGAALAPAAEPDRVIAAVPTTSSLPLTASATPTSDVAGPATETPPVLLEADTVDAPIPAATTAETRDSAAVGTPMLATAATRGLPAPVDDIEHDQSIGTAVAAAATVEPGVTDPPAATDRAAPGWGVAEEQPSPVRGAFPPLPAELANTALVTAPAASADVVGDQAAAPADRPAGATMAAAEPIASSPPAEPEVPAAPSSTLASAGTSSAGTFPSATSSPGQSRLGEITGGELKRSPSPGYPRRARLNGVEGQVTVRYDVDLRGRVDGFEVLSADPGETFVAAVRKAVRRWRHEPFLADGEPVGARVTRTFEFAIRKEPLAAGEKPGAGCQRVTGSRLCRSRDAYQELGIVVVHNPL